MRTEKQIAASRANGAKSRGPVTPEGKRRSPMNSLNHGLFARTLVLEGESRQRFDSLVQLLTAEFKPETPTETLLIHTMAAARWRVTRLWGYETAAISHQIRRQRPEPGAEHPAIHDALAFRALAADAHANPLLLHHEMRLDRQFNNALNRFYKVRAERRRELDGANPAK